MTLSRVSLLAVAAAGAWAVFPIRRGSGWFRRLGIVLLAAICWRSNRQLLFGAPSGRAPGFVENALSRWECLRGALPPGTIAGYSGPVSPSRIAGDYGLRSRGRSAEEISAYFRLLYAESSLVPIVVVNRLDRDFVFAEPAEPAIPSAAGDSGYTRVAECPSGCALYRRRRER